MISGSFGIKVSVEGFIGCGAQQMRAFHQLGAIRTIPIQKIYLMSDLHKLHAVNTGH